MFRPTKNQIDKIQKCLENTDKFLQKTKNFSLELNNKAIEMTTKTSQLLLGVSLITNKEWTDEERKDLCFGVCLYYEYCNKKYGNNWEFDLQVVKNQDLVYMVIDFDRDFGWIFSLKEPQN